MTTTVNRLKHLVYLNSKIVGDKFASYNGTDGKEQKISPYDKSQVRRYVREIVTDKIENWDRTVSSEFKKRIKKIIRADEMLMRENLLDKVDELVVNDEMYKTDVFMNSLATKFNEDVNADLSPFPPRPGDANEVFVSIENEEEEELLNPETPESVDLNETFIAEEEVPEQTEKVPEQVPEQTEVKTKESLEQELKTANQRIKQLVDFVMNMDSNKRDEFSEKIGVLEERVRTLNTQLDNEYQGIGQMFELELANEINKLTASVSALAYQINAPKPDDPNISTDPKEPEPEQVASDTTITGPQKVKRYHPIPLGEFFGSIESDIDWDRELLQTILSSKMTAQEIIEFSENVITEFGRKINVSKRKSDTIEEYNELRQMAFCVMRNLQRGSRSKTASMKVSDLVTLYSGGKYSQESPKQFGENRNFIPKINKVKLSPGDIYIKSESGPSLKYAPRTSRITTDNYL